MTVYGTYTQRSNRRGRPSRTWMRVIKLEEKNRDVNWEDIIYVAHDKGDWRGNYKDCKIAI